MQIINFSPVIKDENSFTISISRLRLSRSTFLSLPGFFLLCARSSMAWPSTAWYAASFCAHSHTPSSLPHRTYLSGVLVDIWTENGWCSGSDIVCWGEPSYVGHLVMSVLRDCMHTFCLRLPRLCVCLGLWPTSRGKDKRTLNSVPGADVVGGTGVVTAVLYRRVWCGVLDEHVLRWIFFYSFISVV